MLKRSLLSGSPKQTECVVYICNDVLEFDATPFTGMWMFVKRPDVNSIKSILFMHMNVLMEDYLLNDQRYSI